MEHAAIVLALSMLIAGSSPAGPAMGQPPAPRNQQSGMEKRGNEAMGFEQMRAAHHFRLWRDGGMIQVQARDAADAQTIAHVRAHLAMLAASLARGDFSAPTHTHGEVPPGVPTMQRLKGQIRYRYRPVARGGRVRIASKNAEAVSAIHDFIRYQIQAHGTGDSTAVE